MIGDRETELEDLARGVATAQADARSARVAIVGTETLPGLRERQTALEQRQDVEARSIESRWQSIERWLEKIDARMSNLEGQRLPSLAVWCLVLCALAITVASVTVAGCGVWAVFHTVKQEAKQEAFEGR